MQPNSGPGNRILMQGKSTNGVHDLSETKTLWATTKQR